MVNPAPDVQDVQLWKLRLKLAAGCSFVQTQAVFDPNPFIDFMDRAQKLSVPILAGILPLRSAKMARWLNKHISGINIPQQLIDRLEQSADPAREGWQIVSETIAAISLSALEYILCP